MDFDERRSEAENEIARAVADLVRDGILDVDDVEVKWHGSLLESGSDGPDPVFRFSFKEGGATALNAFEKIQERCPKCAADGIRFTFHARRNV